MHPASRPAAAALTVALLVLAGCVGGELDDGAPAPGLSEGDLLFQRLAAIPDPDYDRMAAVAWWEHFVTTFTKRDHGLPNNEAAADHLLAELRAAGYDAEILEYGMAINPERPSLPLPVRVVKGVKLGEGNPDHYLGIISHYDTQQNTIEGAYDDGSGVAAQLEICKLLAQVPTNKTISCLFFDAEERGLVGSRLYVDDVVRGGDADFVYDQGFGYDMVGLNWPGYTNWKLYAMAGLNTEELSPHMVDHVEFLEAVLFEFLGPKLGVAGEGVEVLDTHDRNSDEMNFKRAGIPVVRFAGGRHAADYPEYHRPGDTAEYVIDFAGGRENWALGLEMVVLVSYYTILAYDHYDPKAMPRL